LVGCFALLRNNAPPRPTTQPFFGAPPTLKTRIPHPLRPNSPLGSAYVGPKQCRRGVFAPPFALPREIWCHLKSRPGKNVCPAKKVGFFKKRRREVAPSLPCGPPRKLDSGAFFLPPTPVRPTSPPPPPTKSPPKPGPSRPCRTLFPSENAWFFVCLFGRIGVVVVAGWGSPEGRPSPLKTPHPVPHCEGSGPQDGTTSQSHISPAHSAPVFRMLRIGPPR